MLDGVTQQNKARTRNATRALVEQSAADEQQVITMDMVGREDKLSDLPSLVRTIIREAIDTLQPQLNALKKEMTVCSGKIGDVEDALCRITTLEKANGLLRKENDELKVKA